MAIEPRTKDDISEELQGYLASLIPELSAGPDTDVGARIAMLTEALFGLHSQIVGIEDDVFVSDRTSIEALDKHAEARLEGGRKGATTSSGADALRVTGTASTALESGLELVASDGTRFQTTEAETVGVGGTVDVSIASIDTGTDANRSIGETLTFVEPPTGIQAAAELVVATTGAEDAESDGALVRRLLDAYQNPPAGGRFSDWRQWATEVTGVDSAYAYGPSSVDSDGRRGLGIVDVVICASGSGTDRVPTAAVQQAVEDNIEDNRPACTVDFGVILPSATPRSVRVLITPKTGYEFDWVETTTLTITAWSPSTKELTYGFAPDFVVGDRIQVAGQTAIVTAIDNSGAPTTYKCTVDTALTGTIVGTHITPAGPLSDTVRAAITALFDSLGPARGTAADPDQDWDDTLRLASIFDAVMEVEGVKDLTITDPAINITPADTGAAINMLIPGVITVEPTP